MTVKLTTILIALYAWLACAIGLTVLAARDCPSEDGGTVCTWHADRQGSGQGDSFTRLGIFYIYWGS